MEAQKYQLLTEANSNFWAAALKTSIKSSLTDSISMTTETKCRDNDLIPVARWLHWNAKPSQTVVLKGSVAATFVKCWQIESRMVFPLLSNLIGTTSARTLLYESPHVTLYITPFCSLQHFECYSEHFSMILYKLPTAISYAAMVRYFVRYFILLLPYISSF